MSIGTLVGKIGPDDLYEYAVLFDSVTDTAFGPLTSERDVPDGDLWGAMERFVEYVRGTDMRWVRNIPDGELSRYHGLWFAREKDAMLEPLRVNAIEETAQTVGHKYARKLAAVYGLELDADGKIVDEEVGPEEEESAAGLELLKAAVVPDVDLYPSMCEPRESWMWTNKHGTAVFVCHWDDMTRREWACYTLPSTDDGYRCIAVSGPGHNHWDKDKALLWSYVMAAEVRPDGTWPNPMERKP